MKNKKVTVIGSGSSAEKVRTELKRNKVPGIILEGTQKPNTVDINGVLYEEIPRPKQKRNSPLMNQILTFAAMSGALLFDEPKKKERPQVNIIEEYRLIQKKQSKLSRANRDWVEAMFHKRFKRVCNE